MFVRDRIAGTTERVSVSSASAEASGSSFDGAISANGRFVAFTSYASNLVRDDTNICVVWETQAPYNCPDVFVRDASPGGPSG